MQNLNDIIQEAINNATRERGHLNVLIAGRTGVGKSTLINAVFQDNIAETGQGRPVTRNTREITKEGVPLTIFDTRGLEMSEFKMTSSELEKLIKDRCSDRDPNRHIHVAWLCLHEDGRRVEDAEVELHEMLSKHMPLVTVITKSRSDQGVQNEVIKLLPESRNVIRVRAISEEQDDGHTLNPMNLDKLIDLTSEVIPEGKRMALAASQKANINYKKGQAHKVVATAVSLSAATGAAPIPFSDAAILVPIQIGMIAKITAVFGLDITIVALTPIVTSTIGVSGSTLVGKTIVANLMKLFPGIGTVAGATISAATASAITFALGEAYIAALAELFAENPEATPSVTSIAEKLKAKMKQAGA